MKPPSRIIFADNTAPSGEGAVLFLGEIQVDHLSFKTVVIGLVKVLVSVEGNEPKAT